MTTGRTSICAWLEAEEVRGVDVPNKRPERRWEGVQAPGNEMEVQDGRQHGAVVGEVRKPSLVERAFQQQVPQQLQGKLGW
jgi:hypothetical protein